MSRLSGVTVLVTGASSGIGQGTAVRLAEDGAHVVCADIRPCDETADLIAALHERPAVVGLDVSSPGDWGRAVEATIAAHGRIDCLASVAGIYLGNRPDTIVDIAEDDWSRVLAVDLTGVWLGMRTVIPQMIEQGGGRIVNVASLAALRGIPNMAAYSAAKGGVVALTRQAAVEYGAQGVLVNCICPGAIATPALARASAEARDRFSSYQVLRHLGDVSAVAGMIAHCFSEDGAFLTGGVYTADGGWSARA